MFSNTSVVNKHVLMCSKCAILGTTIVCFSSVAEKQLMANSFDRLGFQWQPTFFTNVPRIIVRAPIVLYNDQYWHHFVIQKYLPGIPVEEYTVQHNSVATRVDSSKTTQILSDNWESISKKCTKQELHRIRLGDSGIMSTKVVRK